MATSSPVLILGRDGIGSNATEANFKSWVLYVCDYIDRKAGFWVNVDERLPREIQSDEIRDATDSEHDAIEAAKQSLWQDWCASAGTNAKMTEAAAIELGRKAGREEVETVWNEQGREAVEGTLKPGVLGWDEAAINAGCAKISRVPPNLEEAYYRAYASAARARAEELCASDD
jgi:vacuolar-type H+-ATPase subunit H